MDFMTRGVFYSKKVKKDHVGENRILCLMVFYLKNIREDVFQI
jgi:hypothetical protein